MIHTMRVTGAIERGHVDHFLTVHEMPFEEAPAFLQERFRGITIAVWEQPYQPGISLFIDVPELLGYGTITEKDYQVVEKTLRALLSFAFGDSNLFDSLNLMRIDYRYDVRIPDQEKRKLYLLLYGKTYRKRKALRRVQGKFGDDGLFYEYETSVTHVSQSKSTLVYDKNCERLAKQEKPRDWEMNVIRFEVSLKTRTLKYNAQKEKSITRKIESYFKESLFRKHMREYLIDIYLSGDFYTMDEAISIIYSSSYSDKKKNGLKEFLRYVKKQDLCVPKSKMSTSTFRSRLKDLKKLGIHPVTITDRESTTYKMLPGLLKDL